MTDTSVRTVLVVGAPGRIGRLVVAAALRHGPSVRALAVRDTQRAAGVLAGATLVQGDLTQITDLASAVAGVDAVVLTHGRRAQLPAPGRPSTTVRWPTRSPPWTAGGCGSP